MIRILRDQTQISLARASLREAGLDTSRGWRRAMYSLAWRIRFRCAPQPVAFNKSWDVWTIYNTVLSHAPDRQTQIYEVGSFNSEIPLVLWQAGYRRIRAVDFNPMGRAIRWYGNRIEFRQENFYESDLPSQSVGVMTALSVIEHGYNQSKLVAAAERLLKPGGLLLLTTDYREEGVKIPEDFRAFGLPYRIFSRADLESLVSDASQAGFDMIGSAEWEASEYPIEWENWRFTFAFVGLRKRPT